MKLIKVFPSVSLNIKASQRLSGFLLTLNGKRRTEHEPPANRVSGVLIVCANTQRTNMPSGKIMGHVHLTSCLDSDLSREKDYVHSEQSCVSTDN